MTSKQIQGLTILDRLTDLDPALVAEAEVDACFLPPVSAAERYEHKRARREARATRREENPFFRFAGSGAGAVCISLVVAFALLVGIVYVINHAPFDSVPVGGTTGEAPGGTPENEAATWGDGTIPIDALDTDYIVYTDKKVYATAPSRILLTLRGKTPGVDIAYFQSASMESLTDPEWSGDLFWNDLAEERVEPIGEDEYAEWTKEIHINEAEGILPDGIYRIHHMEYDREKGRYVSGAYCDFAVGLAYGQLLTGQSEGWFFPDIVSVADQDPAHLDEFFAADPSTLPKGEVPAPVTRKTLWHITPAGLYEATGVRVFKNTSGSESYFLLDGCLYEILSFGGFGIHNAVVCDYDLNGVNDVLFTTSFGSGIHRCAVSVFNTETRKTHGIPFHIGTQDTPASAEGESLSDASLLTDLIQNLPDFCVVRLETGAAPQFVVCSADMRPGEHGYADARWTNLVWYAQLVLTEGNVPTMRLDPTPPSADTTYPDAAEKPYTITASMSKNAVGDRGFLSVRYTAAAPGTVLAPIFKIAVRKIGGEATETFKLQTTAEAIEVLPPDDADAYATYAHSWEILNPEAMIEGTYRVYALNYAGACIAYTDVLWLDGYELHSPAESADITVSQIQDDAMLDAFFAADRSGLSDTDIKREKLRYVTQPSFEADGVRLYDYVDGGRSTSFLLTDGVVFDLGRRLCNAIACDVDLDGSTDILFTGTSGSGIQYSSVGVFSLKSRTVRCIYTAILPDAPKYLVVRAVSEQVTDGVSTGVYALYRADYRADKERLFCGTYEDLRLLAELELREGDTPVLHFADVEPEYSVAGDDRAETAAETASSSEPAS